MKERKITVKSVSSVFVLVPYHCENHENCTFLTESLEEA